MKASVAVSFVYLLVAIATLCVPAFAQSNSSVDHQKQIVHMIDAMASRNKEPAMLNHSEVPSGYFYTVAPLVSDDYDWDEQDRVRKAVQAVRDDSSDAMWWQLRQHASDKLYALTVIFDAGMNAKNVLVGEFCRDLTQAYLNEAYRRHLPKVSGQLPFDFILK